MIIASGGQASAAPNEAEARAFFTKFVAAQNAHAASDVEGHALGLAPDALVFAKRRNERE